MAVKLTEPGVDLVRKRKPKIIRRSKWPWEQIRKDYIEGIQINGSSDPLDLSWPTLAKVADAYGVPHGTVQTKAANEKWLAQRRAFQLRTDVIRKKERARLLAQEGRAFDKNVLNISKLGMNVILRRIAEISQSAQMRDQITRQFQQAMERGELVDLSLLNSMPEFDAQEIERLANAATRFEELGRRVLGVPDENAESVVEQMDDNFMNDDSRTNDEGRLIDMLEVMSDTGLAQQLFGNQTLRAIGMGDDDDEAIDAELEDEDNELDTSDADVIDAVIDEAPLVQNQPNVMRSKEVAGRQIFSVA